MYANSFIELTKIVLNSLKHLWSFVGFELRGLLRISTLTLSLTLHYQATVTRKSDIPLHDWSLRTIQLHNEVYDQLEVLLQSSRNLHSWIRVAIDQGSYLAIGLSAWSAENFT